MFPKNLSSDTGIGWLQFLTTVRVENASLITKLLDLFHLLPSPPTPPPLQTQPHLQDNKEAYCGSRSILY